jgi:RecB family exonuclease
MRGRGAEWLAAAAALDRPAAAVPRATRPAPRPPVKDRPRTLAVTQISTLIRDPYAIYARAILKLHPLDPIRAAPDARLRGSVLHRVLEAFERERPEDEPPEAARARLAATARDVLAARVPWAATRLLWAARLDRAADFLIGFDASAGGVPILLEESGAITLPGGFTLTARPDRIDRMPDGRLHIIDYKTGTPPSPKQMQYFDKQLLLEALIAQEGGFAVAGPMPVARVSYLGLGGTPTLVTVETEDALVAEVAAGLRTLIARYGERAQGYPSRRAVAELGHAGDYDHLARYGEWSQADDPVPCDVGGPEDSG